MKGRWGETRLIREVILIPAVHNYVIIEVTVMEVTFFRGPMYSGKRLGLEYLER